MGKKSQTRRDNVEPDTSRKSPAELRRGELDRATLDEFCEKLTTAVARIRTNIGRMEAKNISNVEVDGVTKLKRGVQLVQEFIPNLDRGLLKRL